MAALRGSREATRANPCHDRSCYALRADLEMFEAPDGDVYLLGHDEDHVVARPGPAERELLRALTQRSMTGPEMVQALAQQGAEAAAATAIDQLLESGLLQVHEQSTSLLPAGTAARYDRQLAYFSLTHPGAEHRIQRRLTEACVVIVGLGGLGSWTAAAMSCAGVGRLVLVDDDRVELSNLNRQVLFRPQDIGVLKVEVVAAALRAFNPDLEIELHRERIRDAQGARGFLSGASILVATADWPPYQISQWINRACVDAGVPYISAGQVPPFVRVGPLVVPGRTGCFECGELRARAESPHYEAIVRQRDATEGRAATLGPASAIVGSMIGMEILHYLTGTAQPATWGRSVTLDLRSWRIKTIDLPRDQRCPVCGDAGLLSHA